MPKSDERPPAMQRIKAIRQMNLSPSERSLKLMELAGDYGASTSHLYYEVGNVGMYDDDLLVQRILAAEQSLIAVERSRREARMVRLTIIAVVAAAVSALAAVASWLTTTIMLRN